MSEFLDCVDIVQEKCVVFPGFGVETPLWTNVSLLLSRRCTSPLDGLIGHRWNVEGHDCDHNFTALTSYDYFLALPKLRQRDAGRFVAWAVL